MTESEPAIGNQDPGAQQLLVPRRRRDPDTVLEYEGTVVVTRFLAAFNSLFSGGCLYVHQIPRTSRLPVNFGFLRNLGREILARNILGPGTGSRGGISLFPIIDDDLKGSSEQGSTF